MAGKEEVMDQLDHPFFFMAFGVTPFVIGFGALLLWGAKNAKLNGAARAIQQR